MIAGDFLNQTSQTLSTTYHMVFVGSLIENGHCCTKSICQSYRTKGLRIEGSHFLHAFAASVFRVVSYYFSWLCLFAASSYVSSFWPAIDSEYLYKGFFFMQKINSFQVKMFIVLYSWCFQVWWHQVGLQLFIHMEHQLHLRVFISQKKRNSRKRNLSANKFEHRLKKYWM